MKLPKFFQKDKPPIPPDEKSLGVLHRAYKKAQNVISQAELTSIKVHAQSEIEVAKYTARLEAILKKSTDEANERFGVYLRDLLDQSRQEQERVTKTMQDSLKNEIKSDMETVKKALADYQKTRMEAVEKNLAEVVQKTAELYLGKKLDPETHMELIYEAFEKAKEEKLIQ